MSEFFHMGGYGAYVWGAYGLSTVILVLNLFIARRRSQQVWKQLSRENRRS